MYAGRHYEDWQLDDPAGLDLASIRRIRDEIRARVERLLLEIGVSADPG